MEPLKSPEFSRQPEHQENHETETLTTPQKFARMATRGYEQARELILRVARLTGNKSDLPDGPEMAEMLTHAPEAGDRSTLREQIVLPETIERMADEASDVVNLPLRRQLREHQWTAYELRDSVRTPDINFLIASEQGTREESQKMVEGIETRAKRISDFLGYERDDILPFTVLIDPTDAHYKDAAAFINNRNMWVKLSGKGRGIDHELVHAITKGVLPDGKCPASTLAVEGIAGWAAWQVKDEPERAGQQIEDYPSTNARVWSQALKSEEMSLDMEINPTLARDVGAALFEVLNAELGNDPKKLGREWINVNSYAKLSEWVESTGLDSKDVEKKWKTKIFGAQV